MFESQAKQMEKSKQDILKNDYLQVMEDQQKRKMKEKANDLYLGQMANQRAMREQDMFNQAAKEKKDMIKNMLSSGYGYQEAQASKLNMETLDPAEKITLQKTLDLDNKLREFSNVSGKTYANYSNSVLSPAQMKIKIQEDLRKKYELDEK